MTDSLDWLQYRMRSLLTASLRPDTVIDATTERELLAILFRYGLACWIAGHVGQEPNQQVRKRLTSIASGDVGYILTALGMIQSGSVPDTQLASIVDGPVQNLKCCYNLSVSEQVKAKRVDYTALIDRLFDEQRARGISDAKEAIRHAG